MNASLKSSRVRQFRIILIIVLVSYIIEWIAPFLSDLSGHASGSLKNLSNLRDTSHFNWNTIALIGAVSFAYAIEIEKKNWSGILAGLSFFLVDLFHEIWNGLIFTATDYHSAYWMCGFQSSFQTLIGWNIEIMICFLFFGLCVTKGLPEDKDAMIFGKINNRIVFVLAWAMLGVIVEIILNSYNALIWNYWWWSARFPFLIITTAYIPFTAMAIWVYDLPTVKSQIKVVATMGAILLISLVVFIAIGWI